jgi:3-phytase
MRKLGALAVVSVGAVLAASPVTAAPAPSVSRKAVSIVQVSSVVETVPVAHSGDAADDPAIWVNPNDPSRSRAAD